MELIQYTVHNGTHTIHNGTHTHTVHNGTLTHTVLIWNTCGTHQQNRLPTCTACRERGHGLGAHAARIERVQRHLHGELGWRGAGGRGGGEQKRGQWGAK